MLSAAVGMLGHAEAVRSILMNCRRGANGPDGSSPYPTLIPTRNIQWFFGGVSVEEPDSLLSTGAKEVHCRQ